MWCCKEYVSNSDDAVQVRFCKFDGLWPHRDGLFFPFIMKKAAPFTLVVTLETVHKVNVYKVKTLIK